MVTSVKKLGLNDKATITGWKVPFLDLYLVRGTEIRDSQESKIIKAKMMARLLKHNWILKKRLERWEG